jgi:hypothetical protein
VLFTILPDLRSAAAPQPVRLLSELREQLANASSPIHQGNVTRSADPSYFLAGGFCRQARCGLGTCRDSAVGFSCECPVPFIFDASDCSLCT